MESRTARFERIASELLRALRGRRSQMVFARRLGYRSNVAHAWETGRSFPTASQTLRIAERLGADLRASLQKFYRNPPAWLANVDLASPAGVAHLLRDLRGHTAILDLARSSGLSRFTTARMISGKTEPRLPDFLRLVEAASMRMLDLVHVLVDPYAMPSIATEWRALQAARSAAYDEPWTLAVVRTLELKTPTHSAKAVVTFVEKRLGIPRQTVERCLDLLLQSGQIHLTDGRYRVIDERSLDTRYDPERARLLRKWWLERAAERFGEGDERIFSYSVFGVSASDYLRLRELHRAYFRELRAIVAQSFPVERVVLASMQLVGLDDPTAREDDR